MKKNSMKTQKPFFSVGDIVTCERNGFRRKIRSIEHEERQGMMKVLYSYYNEQLDEGLQGNRRVQPIQYWLVLTRPPVEVANQIEL